MIDFPASPTDGQIFSATNGVVYKYSATYTSWLAQNPAPQVGGTGDFATAGTPALSTTPQAMIMPVVNGNSGNWYNPANGRWTPPAGKYHLYGAVGGYWNGGNLTTTASLRKNGVTILTNSDSGFTNAWGFCSVEANVDANGTDYFDLWASVNTAATGSQGYFGAFPLTGITGPTGSAGPPGSGPANSDFCAIASTTVNLTGTAALVIVPSPAIVGNAGGYYNATTGRYTPPAGRYRISIAGSPYNSGGTAGSANLHLRKNGATILNQVNTTTGAGSQIGMSTEAVVDANGTDYFEIWGLTGASVGQLSFLTFMSFPTQGLIGPQGPPGTPFTSPVWQQVSETVLGATATNLDVTVPVGAKQFQIDFELQVTGGSNDTIMFTVMQGAVAYLTSDQMAQQMYGAGTSAGAQVLGPAAFMSIGNCVTMQGRITGSLQAAPRTTFMATAVVSELGSGSGRVVRTVEVDCGALRSSITGFRLRCGLGTLSAGSTARVSVLQ